MNNPCKTIGCTNEIEESLTDYCNPCLIAEPMQYKIGENPYPFTIPERRATNRYSTDREEAGFKDVSEVDEIDIFQIHYIFNLPDPSGALQEASRKLLLCGGSERCVYQDVEEARNILNRWLQFAEPTA